MLYLITGKMARTQEVLRLTHEDHVQMIQSKVVPTLRLLTGDTTHGKVLAGGAPAGSRDVVLIADLNGPDSHRCVRHFLASLPMFEYYDWQATPLESFEEMGRDFGG